MQLLCCRNFRKEKKNRRIFNKQHGFASQDSLVIGRTAGGFVGWSAHRLLVRVGVCHVGTTWQLITSINFKLKLYFQFQFQFHVVF